MRKICGTALVFLVSWCGVLQGMSKYEAAAKEQRFEDIFPSSAFQRTFASLDEAYEYVRIADAKFLQSIGNKGHTKGAVARLVGPPIPGTAAVTVACSVAPNRSAGAEPRPGEALLALLIFSNNRGVSMYYADAVGTADAPGIGAFSALGKTYQANYPAGWGIDQGFQYLQGDTPPPKQRKLIGLKEAVAGGVGEVEKRLAKGTAIAVAGIDAPQAGLAELVDTAFREAFGSAKKVTVLAHPPAAEPQSPRMTGWTDDASAVRMGQALGAKAALTGTFDRFANFSQLRIRLIGVPAGELIASYSALIRKDDAVLAEALKGLLPLQPAVMTEEDLTALNRGRDAFAAGNHASALAEFDTVLGGNNRSGEAYFCRGFAYAAEKDYPQSVKSFSAALAVNPQDVLVLKNRGVVYLQLGEYEQAQKDFDEAHRLDPSYQAPAVAQKRPPEPPDFFAQGKGYYETGKYDDAIKALTEVLKTDAENTDALLYRAAAYGQIGWYALQQADYARAEQILRIRYAPP